MKKHDAHINQQAAVAQLGQLALLGTDLSALMGEAVALVAQNLKVEYAELWELLPNGQALLLQAGVGWNAELVGHATISTALNSELSHTLLSQEPVIVADIRQETRFNSLALFQEQGIISSLSVIILGQKNAYGILVAHSTQQQIFTQADIYFLQSIANILATAIERQRTEQKLRKAKDELELRVAERTGELVGVNERLRLELQERSSVEDALRQSEARFRPLFESNIVGVIFANFSGQITDANDLFLKMVGYSRADLLAGKVRWDDMIPPEYRHLDQRAIEQSLNPQVGIPWEKEFIRQDGSRVPVLVGGTLLDGYDDRIVAFVLDITERKRTEEALRVSQARFAGILDIASDAIISVNESQGITLFNQGAEKIFGYTAQEVLGQPLDLLLPSRFVQAHRQHVVEFSQTARKSRKMGERREIFGRRQDGTEFPAEASISRLEVAGEQVFTTILRDISDAYRQAAQRKQAEQALEQLSRQNELILNSVGEGLCGLDLRLRTTFVNPAAAKLLGYQVQELLGQPIDIIFSHSNHQTHPYSPEDSPIYASLSDGIVHQGVDEVFWRKDGSSFSVEYVSTPIREQGEIVGVVIAFKDITERQIVERMKDEFISVVSHELRTPLTSIHGALGMLASGLLDAEPETGKRLLEIAVDSTQRLVRLINDILDIERIESGKVTMVKQTCDAADLMTQATEVMQAMAKQAGVTLSISTTSTQLWADPDRILQALTNLLSNAIKFSPPGATIWLTAQTQEHQILFQVKDQGRGIPADKLETIFERFGQVDASDSRNHEGTGLGLAICRSIVQQHGGQIWAESILGEGSIFSFTLPLSSAEC